MAEPEVLPEPDRLDGAPHPRAAPRLFGQRAAEDEFLSAYTSGRLHHAWLISGARGRGKATLAWRLARFLLATPPEDDDGLFGAPPPPTTLDIDPEHPVARRLMALSDPGLFLLRRYGAGPESNRELRHKNYLDGKFSDEIRVSEVREVTNFFHMSASDGGRRVVIVDAADEMNPQAANALLKMLEEPPDRATFLLIAHQPARLLPTIRSRCRTLRLAPLDQAAMQAALDQAGVTLTPEETAALSALAEGSVGAAIRLHHQDGLALYAEILAVLGGNGRGDGTLDRPRLIALAESCAGKGREDRLAMLLTLTDVAAARLARTGVTSEPPAEIVPGEVEVLRRLAPNAARGRLWAELVQEAGDRARHARAVNVDPAFLVTDLFLHLRAAV